MSAVTAASEFDLTKHVNYTAGMILGVDDFTQEFAYLSGRDRWMAREALGYGTVSGLAVRTEEDEKNGPRVAIEPGVAISPRGQLICVPAAQCAYLNQWLAAADAKDLENRLRPVKEGSTERKVTLCVVLCYRDCPVDNMPIPGEPCRNEKELTEASRIKDDFSLELRFEAPEQPEENAVREYSDFLKGIEISTGAKSTPIERFLDALRDRFLDRKSTGVRLAALRLNPEDVSEYMRKAFRLWTTELRIHKSNRETGCAVEMTAEKKLEDCILLAKLGVVVDTASDLEVKKVDVDIDGRPWLLHLRMLQEWMLNGNSRESSTILPLATITGLGESEYEIWFNIDTPLNSMEVIATLQETERNALIGVGVTGETATDALEPIQAIVRRTRVRNVFQIALEKEMPYMRFEFRLDEIMVKGEKDTDKPISLAAFAKQNAVRFEGERDDKTATIFVRGTSTRAPQPPEEKHIEENKVEEKKVDDKKIDDKKVDDKKIDDKKVDDKNIVLDPKIVVIDDKKTDDKKVDDKKVDDKKVDDKKVDDKKVDDKKIIDDKKIVVVDPKIVVVDPKKIVIDDKKVDDKKVVIVAKNLVIK
jgi:hypothetical protein